MPRYHCLGTEVQLCIQDSCPSLTHDHQKLVMQAQTYLASHTRSASSKDASVSPESVSPPNSNRSVQARRLAEGHFRDCEGVDILGCDIPFFLVQAGYESSHDIDPAELLMNTKSSIYHDRKLTFGSPRDLLGTKSEKRASTTARAVPIVLDESPVVSGDQRYKTDAEELYLSSDGLSLPSISSTDLRSPYASDSKDKEADVEIGGQRPECSSMTPKAPARSPDNHGLSYRISELQAESKPIHVVVKLSEKSFINPFLGVENNHCDICVNIFYNGEFNTSKVVKYSEWLAKGSEDILKFGGRRTGINHELPWIITKKKDNAGNLMSHASETWKSSTPPNRWDELRKMLLLESNEWCTDEYGQKCLIGKYLELLSVKTMPAELECPLVGTQMGFGVIDVVITIGRASQLSFAKSISSPRRILHPSQPCKDFSSLLPPPRISCPVVAPCVQTGLHSLEITTHKGSALFKNADSQGVKQTRSMSTPSGDVLARDANSRPPHLKRPENVPQKTYRGSEAPPLKRQKTANFFDELPFDLNTATYMSTRARRSASTLFSQTPPKSQLEGSTTKKRNVNQAKDTLSKVVSLLLNVAESPMNLSRNKLKNPKTPEFEGPLQKKPRSSNYNPRLSNRPQNLRRKNSAGEWVIPPCRRNSVGEWETPTKGKQVTAASLLRENGDGVGFEGKREFSRPVFTLSKEIASRNTVIGSQISKKVDESIDLDGPAPKIIADIQSNKDCNSPSNPLMQKKEVSIPGVYNKVTIPPLKTIRRDWTRLNTQALATKSTAVGSTFGKSFYRDKKNTIVASNGNLTGKNTLLMKFFEVKVNTAGRTACGECKTRWLVRRCISPEYMPSPGADSETASPFLSKMLKLKLSASASSCNGEKIIGVLADSTLTESGRKPNTETASNPSNASEPVIKERRGSTIETSQEIPLPVITQRRTHFVIQNHKSKVVKLSNRRLVATNVDSIKQDAWGTTNWTAENNTASLKVRGDVTQAMDVVRPTDRPVPATPDSHQNKSLPNTGLVTLFGPRSVENNDKVSSGQPSNALLESHDRYKSINTSSVAPLGTTTSQSLTTTSRRVRPLEPWKTNKTRKVVADKLNTSDTLIVQLPIRRMGLSKGCNSSDQYFRKTVDIPTVSKRKIEDIDKAILGTVNTHFSDGDGSDATYSEVNKTSLCDDKEDMANIVVSSAVAYSISPSVTDGHPQSDEQKVLAAPKSVSEPPKMPGFPKCTIPDLEEQLVICATRAETLVGQNYDALTKRPVFRHRKSEGLALQTDVNDQSKSTKATGEVGEAIRQPTKSKTDIKRATGDYGSQNDCLTVQSVFQNKSAFDTDEVMVSNAKIANESITGVCKSQEQNKPTQPALSAGLDFWKPGRLCEDSILAFASNQDFDGVERNASGDQMCRPVEVQEEEHFKALGVLLGVRYVVVGSTLAKE